MVPVNPPKLYFKVCVKLELALLILIVVELPIFPSAQVTLDVRGIVINTICPDALPLYGPYPDACAKSGEFTDTETVLLPSELWVIALLTTLPNNTEAFFSIVYAPVVNV